MLSPETLSSRPEPLVLDLLADGLSVEVLVTGGSMSPCIRGSDTVTLVPIGNQRLRLGDVIAFTRPGGRLVIHRVIALSGDRLRPRGDATARADAWITRQSLIGQVAEVSRRGRRARLGLGPEKWIIAWLSRAGLLTPLLRPVRWLARLWRKKASD